MALHRPAQADAIHGHCVELGALVRVVPVVVQDGRVRRLAQRAHEAGCNARWRVLPLAVRPAGDAGQAEPVEAAVQIRLQAMAAGS
jgi:hypothetical protein